MRRLFPRGDILKKSHDTIDRKHFAGLIRRVLRGDQEAVTVLRNEYGGRGWMLDAVIATVVEAAPKDGEVI